VACHFPACGDAEFYDCGKCHFRYCMRHRHAHGCLCDVAHCGKETAGLCGYCQLVLCTTHQSPKLHPCTLCNHATNTGTECTRPAEAQCPECSQRYCETHLAGHSRRGLTPRGPVRCNAASALRARSLGLFKANAADGVCIVCGPKSVVRCPECNQSVCVTHNDHSAPSNAMDLVHTVCGGVTNPAKRAILLGRLPDGATATSPTFLPVRCTRALTPLDADKKIKLDDFADLTGCKTLGQLYRLLLGSGELRKACVELVGGWVLKAKRLPASRCLDELAVDQLGRSVVRVDMSRSGWLDTMLLLCELRSKVNARHGDGAHAVWNLCQLAFTGCTVLVLNHKTLAGTGTTRMLWPIRLESDGHDYRDHQVRVADLTYGELTQLVMEVLLPAFKKDHAALAQLLLGLLEGTGSAIGELRSTQCRISRLRCSFLRGVVGADEGLRLCSRWWLTRKSLSSLECDFRPTAYEISVNLLSILFLAEPRHARVMYPATKALLGLVASGHLTFHHVFSTLGGVIAHGRLLPGANVLGPPLRLTPDKKRLAMPMADLSDAGLLVLGSNDRSQLPQAQPLMKVLFVALLHELCAAGWKPSEPEGADRVDRLDADEEDERGDGLDAAGGL
jgi:hypothetical protein